MISGLEWDVFARKFPSLLSDKESKKLLRDNGITRRVSAGDILYRDGDECTHLPLVVTGELLLSKHGESGRAITLYRVEDGESCILSTLSILNQELFPAEATSRSASSLVLVPAEVLRLLIDRDERWRQFVFSTYHQRLSGLIALIEEVVFGKLDVRLAELLLERSERRGGVLRTTHQELAEELGSSREVVSRLLKEWERQGLLKLRRGEIALQDPEGLKEFHR